MIVSLITKKQYIPIRLPDRTDGFFSLKDAQGQELFNAVGDGIAWTIQETRLGRLPKGQPIQLVSGMLIGVHIGSDMQTAYLFAEEAGKKYAKYARCQVSDNAEFTIGSARNNSFVCINPQISAQHCKLVCRNRVWGVSDLGSRTGTYVNGKRISTGIHRLNPGDLVSVLNQKFIVLPGLLAFNAQNLDVNALNGRVKPIKVPSLSPDQLTLPEEPIQFFRRKPRFTDNVQEKEFSVKAPPSLADTSKKQSAVLSYGPAVVSGAAMLLTGMNPLYGVGMLASSILFPKLSRDYTKKQQIKENERLQKAYADYLQRLELELNDLHDRQTALLRKQTPAPVEQMERILVDNTNLWSHRPEHADYMNLRIGHGDIPVRANISFPEEILDMQETSLQQMLTEFQEKPRLLKNVPILMELKRFPCVGISGTSTERETLAALLIGQLAMNIGFDDMKICLIGPLKESLKPLVWLPHTWNDSKTFHMIAENQSELDILAPILSKRIEKKSSDSPENNNGKKPDMIILITDPAIAQSGMITRLLFDNPCDGVYVITLAEHSAQLPSRTNAAIAVKGGYGRMVWQEEGHKELIDFHLDKSAGELLPKLVFMMANTCLDNKKTAFVLPTIVPFLDLFGVQDVRQLNLTDRWARADASRYLPAPLGISEDGTICTLDLSEKTDGPHGLIAGTTGSGKSELIMSLILSLAVCYSPEDISFLLIDYKGGGMAQAFAGLPHTAGIITNLDGNEIRRSMASIESELQRRQRVFSDAMKKLGMSKMEIDQYQRCYREKKLTDPMPRLIIITDEFAELKAQNPEFMTKLISAARIGRSLGVHLILATQQPAGVVNEQIWGNSNFKICLRVQSDADSKQVLKSPEAAGLTNPGTFYKQVGAIMTLAQSAWAGADYTPNDRIKKVSGVEVLDHNGNVIGKSELKVQREASTVTQATAVVEYITETAKSEGVSVRPLWNPALEGMILLDSLYDHYHPQVFPWVLEPVLGELDDPERQSRDLVRIPLTDGKNTIFYGGIGSGKRMVLSTVLADLMTRHTPEELHIYVMDFEDDGLQILKDAPHVGDVLTADDKEKTVRLVAMLEKEIARRKKMLSGTNASLPTAERLQQAGLPFFLIVLHGLGRLKNSIEGLMTRLTDIMKDGQRWGLLFMATHSTSSGLGFQLEECFTRKYVLQMGKDDDYLVLLGRTGGMKPSARRGCGLLKLESKLYEFQTATLGTELSTLCARLQDEWSGPCAEPMRTMPQRVDADCLSAFIDAEKPLRLPVGMNPQTIDPVYYPFDSHMVHIVLGRKRDLDRFLRGLVTLAAKAGLSPLVLDPAGLDDPPEGVEVPDAEMLDHVLDDMVKWGQKVRIAVDANEPFEAPQRLVLIPSIHGLLARLSEQEQNCLRALLYRARPEWNWSFVVCDSPREFRQLFNEKDDLMWLEKSVSIYDGIYLGGGIRGHDVLSTEGHTKDLNSDLVFPMGYVIRDEVPERVRFLSEV